MTHQEFLSLYLTKRLADGCNGLDYKLKRKKALEIISSSRLKVKYIRFILKDLERKGFIEIINQKNIKINKERLKECEDWF